MSKKEVTPQQALLKLESLCARSERCTYELRQKLSSWQISGDTATKIINHLKNLRYVDDQRFAMAYCRDKFKFSKWGKLKITQELAAKRIIRELIINAIADIDDEEYKHTLIELLRHKSQMISNANSYEGKTKLFRFGVSRGFEISLVSEIIKSGVLWKD